MKTEATEAATPTSRSDQEPPVVPDVKDQDELPDAKTQTIQGRPAVLAQISGVKSLSVDRSNELEEMVFSWFGRKPRLDIANTSSKDVIAQMFYQLVYSTPSRLPQPKLETPCVLCVLLCKNDYSVTSR